MFPSSCYDLKTYSSCLSSSANSFYQGSVTSMFSLISECGILKKYQAVANKSNSFPLRYMLEIVA